MDAKVLISGDCLVEKIDLNVNMNNKVSNSFSNGAKVS